MTFGRECFKLEVIRQCSGHQLLNFVLGDAAYRNRNSIPHSMLFEALSPVPCCRRFHRARARKHMHAAEALLSIHAL